MSEHDFSVLSLPIITEPWQADLLIRRMNLCRSIYNALADERERVYRRMCQDASYIAARAVIDEVYALPEEIRGAAKEDGAYRAAVRTQTAVLCDYGFTAYSCHERAVRAAADYKGILPSRVAHFSIGEPLWRAWHRFLTGRSDGVKRKRMGDLRTLISDGRSGIRLLDEAGHAHRDGIELLLPDGRAQRLSVIYGRSSGRRVLRMALSTDPRDAYMCAHLRRPLHQLRIVRTEDAHGRMRFVLQLVLAQNSR